MRVQQRSLPSSYIARRSRQNLSCSIRRIQGESIPNPFQSCRGLTACRSGGRKIIIVDELFSGVVQLGAPLLAALFPRAWLDVNREPYELDPRMFDGPLPPFANIGSMRVAGGLGTIPRLVAENMDIYRGRLSVEEGLSRIERVYRPYHASLRKMIAQTHVQFGKAILIDCHSMPANVRVAGGSRRPDIIIGDRYGASAAHDLSRAAVAFLSGLGYHVVRNKPYAGGFITEHYGRPSRGLHALQIEVNRGLYVDEEHP
jgi:N-formylglutamate deformylase